MTNKIIENDKHLDLDKLIYLVDEDFPKNMFNPILYTIDNFINLLDKNGCYINIENKIFTSLKYNNFFYNIDEKGNLTLIKNHLFKYVK